MLNSQISLIDNPPLKVPAFLKYSTIVCDPIVVVPLF